MQVAPLAFHIQLHRQLSAQRIRQSRLMRIDFTRVSDMTAASARSARRLRSRNGTRFVLPISSSPSKRHFTLTRQTTRTCASSDSIALTCVNSCPLSSLAPHPVQKPAVNLAAKGRMGPLAHRFRGLHVVVPINQHRGPAGRTRPFAVQNRMSLRRHRPPRWSPARRSCEASHPRYIVHIISSRRIAAHARDPYEGLQFAVEARLVTRDEGGDIRRRLAARPRDRAGIDVCQHTRSALCRLGQVPADEREQVRTIGRRMRRPQVAQRHDEKRATGGNRHSPSGRNAPPAKMLSRGSDGALCSCGARNIGGQPRRMKNARMLRIRPTPPARSVCALVQFLQQMQRFAEPLERLLSRQRQHGAPMQSGEPRLDEAQRCRH